MIATSDERHGLILITHTEWDIWRTCFRIREALIDTERREKSTAIFSIHLWRANFQVFAAPILIYFRDKVRLSIQKFISQRQLSADLAFLMLFFHLFEFRSKQAIMKFIVLVQAVEVPTGPGI